MYVCVCVFVYVCVCAFFVALSTKLSSRKKKLYVNVKSYFAFLPVSFLLFYISNTYIIASVIQVESIQGDLTEPRSLNWEKMQETKRQ